MAKLSKKAKLIKSKVDRAKQYSVTEAVQILKELGTAKFNEAIEKANNSILKVVYDSKCLGLDLLKLCDSIKKSMGNCIKLRAF